MRQESGDPYKEHGEVTAVEKRSTQGTPFINPRPGRVTSANTKTIASKMAKIDEIQEVVDVVNCDAHPESGSDGESEHEDGTEHAADGVDTPGAGSSSQSKKKKKKKRKVAAKLLSALNPSNKNLPQPLVDAVMEKMREEHGEGSAEADEETVRKALEHLKVMDVIKGKAGVGGRGKKDTGGHKVSKTWPSYAHEYLRSLH